jgi:hypothetical protein
MSRRLVLVASFLLAAQVSLGAGPAGGPANMISTDIMVPAAGRGPGATGSFWVIDLWIRCPAGGDATLEFHGLDSPSAAPLATATVHMNQPVVYLGDVIKTAFGIDSGFGNTRIRSSQPATATLRLYSPGGEGSYGFAFMGMRASMGMGASSMGLQLRIEMDDQMQGMMMALATVTDNVTNDGYLIMGSMMDAST